MQNGGGYDADWFRGGLKEKNIEPCVPSCGNRKGINPHDAKIYRARQSSAKQQRVQSWSWS
jgi:hypothetical protein